MDPELRAELLRRAEQDKATRIKVIGERGDGKLDRESVSAVDAQNVAWLKTAVGAFLSGRSARARHVKSAARHAVGR